MSTSAEIMTEPYRRGLKPGQRHSGQFKKGDDSRRGQGMVLQDGKTFAAKARELGADVLHFWDGLWRDENAPLPMRLRASELIVERGFGKAASTLDINVNDARQLNTLTIEELEAIANGEQPRFPIAMDGSPTSHDDGVIEADFTTVDTTAGET